LHQTLDVRPVASSADDITDRTLGSARRRLSFRTERCLSGGT